MNIETLSKEIEAIKDRNKKVEANKAWETSWTRKASLVLVTYIVVTLCLYVIHNSQPFINAIIPSVGFFLSTQSLPFIRVYWEKHIYMSQEKTDKDKLKKAKNKQKAYLQG